MDEVGPQHWEIGKLELRPGQIIILRFTPDERMSGTHIQAVMTEAKKCLASALETVGLKGKVPILVITNAFDITTICPLEFMDLCVTAKQSVP